MQILCRTNLDLSMERWPMSLPCIPSVGDKIQSSTHHAFNKFQLKLEVIEITWCCNGPDNPWFPHIELHIPRNKNWSIKQFYEWYAPLVGKSVSSFI